MWCVKSKNFSKKLIKTNKILLAFSDVVILVSMYNLCNTAIEYILNQGGRKEMDGRINQQPVDPSNKPTFFGKINTQELGLILILYPLP